MTAHAVLIHDQPSLRHLFASLLRGWSKRRVKVEEAGYDVRLPGVWQRWMDEADIFVLGLERRYDLGMRAEGVTVAENLIRSGKRALVVGSEANARHLMSPIYWDIGSEETFLEAVDRCLSNRQPNLDDVLPLTGFFEERLAIPTGH